MRGAFAFAFAAGFALGVASVAMAARIASSLLSIASTRALTDATVGFAVVMLTIPSVCAARTGAGCVLCLALLCQCAVAAVPCDDVNNNDC